jgi:Flp pilus assembly protein TadD
MKITFNKSFLFFLLILSFVSFAFAQTEREKGIELFKQGKNKEAVAVLEQASKKRKTDAEIWNYLGLAYIKINNLKKAVKAIEKSVGLEPQNALYQTNLAYAYLLSNKLGKARDERQSRSIRKARTLIMFAARQLFWRRNMTRRSAMPTERLPPMPITHRLIY